MFDSFIGALLFGFLRTSLLRNTNVLLEGLRSEIGFVAVLFEHEFWNSSLSIILSKTCVFQYALPLSITNKGQCCYVFPSLFINVRCQTVLILIQYGGVFGL